MVTPADSFFTDPVLGRNKVRIAYVTNPEDVTRAIELLGLGIQAYNARKG
jgi:aspartate aminotransferase